MVFTPAVWILFAYGLFALVGGIIGFVKARSAASLVAGALTAAIVWICARLALYDTWQAWITAGALAAILGFRFFMTWRQKKRVMPDMLMFLFSLITLTACIWAMILASPRG